MNYVVYTDRHEGYLSPDAIALNQPIGNLLASTYPGYRWRCTPHPHPRLPFVDIQVEETASVKLIGHGPSTRAVPMPIGCAIKVWQFHSWSSLRREVIRRGGELLEAFRLDRRAFNLDQFVQLKSDPSRNRCGLLIVPTL